MPGPTTPFEKRGNVAPWTTLAEGDAFLTALDTYSSRITTSIIGKSEGGANMRLVKLHAGTPATRTILFVAQQHGSELSGREAMFTRLRDWADRSDTTFINFLQNTTILCIPTAHPDNITVRENVNGVNVNRDHLNLTQAETRVIHQVIEEYRPSLIVDLHEGANIKADYATAPPINPNADPEILYLSSQLTNVVNTAIRSSGRTVELYQGGNIVGPEYFAEAAALRNSVSILLETARAYNVETDAKLRHSLHLTAIDAIFNWYNSNRVTIQDASSGARSRQGVRRNPFKLAVGTSNPDTALLINPVPDDYVLTPAQYTAIAPHREIFGIEGMPSGVSYIISMAQASQALIPYLVDQSSILKEVTATRKYDVSSGGGTYAVPTVGLPIRNPRYKFRSGGVTRNVALIKIRIAGRTYTVYRK